MHMPFETNSQEEYTEAGLGRNDAASHDQVHPARTRRPFPPHTARLQSDAYTDGDAPTTGVLLKWDSGRRLLEP